jgi:hypothetical protein
MKIEDVLKVFSLLMPKTFVDWFVFIWGHEQCSKIVGQISLGSTLLFKGFETRLLWLLWTTLWEGRSNITHWWWT